METAADIGRITADVAPRTPTRTGLDGFYGPVAIEMAEVEDRLRAELQSRYEELQPIIRHGALLGGKRLRPALVLLSGAASGLLNEDHITIATVLEMIHTATLVHDDVLDGAERRRHVHTVNSKWSNSASILLGDYLFSHSYYLAATLGSTEACRAIGQAARSVCEGELRQNLNCGNFELDEETYIELIQGKTAELTRVSCQLGACLTGSSDRIVRSLAQFGEFVGIAFQIADDYLDIWGSDQQVGKTLGSDLLQGKLTLPLIRLVSQSTGSQKQQVLKILQGSQRERLAQILPLLEASDAREYTREMAVSYVSRGLESLDELPESHARDCLRRIARFAIDRNY